MINIVSVPQSTGVLNFGIVNAGTSITITNIDSTYQKGPIFTVGSVASTGTSVTTMLVTNVTVSSASCTEEVGLFIFSAF